jgi:hypothetical protein
VQPVNQPNSLDIIDFHGRNLHIEGVIELVWTFDSPEQSSRTEFLIVTMEDSNFDIILGREILEQYLHVKKARKFFKIPNPIINKEIWKRRLALGSSGRLWARK